MQLELFQRNGVKKLENKIHIYELDCYKNATEEQKKRMRVRKIDMILMDVVKEWDGYEI